MGNALITVSNVNAADMIFTLIAAIGAITGIIINLWSAHKRGADDEAKSRERSITTENKVDIIFNDVKEIKAQMKTKDETMVELRMALADHENRITLLEKKTGD